MTEQTEAEENADLSFVKKHLTVIARAHPNAAMK